MRRLEHGMILRSKNVMDDALPELAAIKELVPECLHAKLDKIINSFHDSLCDCDISDDVERLEEYLESAREKASKV